MRLLIALTFFGVADICTAEHQSDICARSFVAKTSKGIGARLNKIKSTMLWNTGKDILAKPVAQKVRSKSLSHQRQKSGHRNVVVILTSHKSRADLETDELDRLVVFEKRYIDFLSKKAILEHSLSKPTVASCRRALKKKGFDYEAFRKLADELSSDRLGRSFVEGEQIMALINGVKTNLLLPWEIIQGKTANELREVFSHRDLKNLVLVGHGDDNGQLRDFHGTPVSRDSLWSIGSNVESLSIFSCHSNDAVEFYSIKELFANLPSTDQTRWIHHVKPRRLFGMHNIALIGTVGNFLQMVDANLARGG